MKKKHLKNSIFDLLSIVNDLLAIINHLRKFSQNVSKRNNSPKMADFI